MPEATWKPHEKHGRLTMQSDLPDSVSAFPLNYFAMPVPAASSFEFWESMASATNSGFVHLSFVSDCFPTVHKEMKYESSRCPPIWRS
jgi:hypothetical protein